MFKFCFLRNPFPFQPLFFRSETVRRNACDRHSVNAYTQPKARLSSRWRQVYNLTQEKTEKISLLMDKSNVRGLSCRTLRLRFVVDNFEHNVVMKHIYPYSGGMMSVLFDPPFCFRGNVNRPGPLLSNPPAHFPSLMLLLSFCIRSLQGAMRRRRGCDLKRKAADGIQETRPDA